MDETTRALLDGIFIYAEILNNTNMKFKELVEENTEKQLYENEQLFYEIISEIIRLFPLKKERGGTEIIGVDSNAGILLLETDIPFLLEDYKRIIDNNTYKKIMSDLSFVRNKFVHEPHNMRVGFYVGGKASCSMGIYYKNELCSISTIKISYIIYELNEVFEKLKIFWRDKVNNCGEEYKEYPCYEAMLRYNFRKYNMEYPIFPIRMFKEDEIELK